MEGRVSMADFAYKKYVNYVDDIKFLGIILLIFLRDLLLSLNEVMK